MPELTLRAESVLGDRTDKIIERRSFALEVDE